MIFLFNFIISCFNFMIDGFYLRLNVNVITIHVLSISSSFSVILTFCFRFISILLIITLVICLLILVFIRVILRCDLDLAKFVDVRLKFFKVRILSFGFESLFSCIFYQVNLTIWNQFYPFFEVPQVLFKVWLSSKQYLSYSDLKDLPNVL